MKVLTGRNSGRIQLTKQIASSGEGTVWETSQKGYLAKQYHQPDGKRGQKLEVMLANPPHEPNHKHKHISFAWPHDLLEDNRGQVVGFLMPMISDSVKLPTIYNPTLRNRKWPEFNWRYLHTAALNIASILQALHQDGYVVGDIKPQNLLVNSQALVSIIDTDSFQVQDPAAPTTRIYRCPVGSEGFTPAELLGKDLSRFDQTEVHDRFRLAVIIYLLLFGEHPFKGEWRGQGDSPQPTELIQKGLWAHSGDSSIKPGRYTIPLDVVHPQLQACFRRCFTEGHQNPQSRPTAQAWAHVLKTALADLKGGFSRKTKTGQEAACNGEGNVYHAFSRSHHRVHGYCYWCQRQKALGLDIFSPELAKQAKARKQKSQKPKTSPTTTRRSSRVGGRQPVATMPKLWVTQSGHLVTALSRTRRHRSQMLLNSIAQSSRLHRQSGSSPQLRWSNTMVGGTLCALSVLGLLLLLLPELNGKTLENFSRKLEQTLTQQRSDSTRRTPPDGTSPSFNTEVFNLSASDPAASLGNQQGHWDAVTALSISPDSKLLVSGSRDKTLKIWQLETGKLLATLSAHREPIVSVNFPRQGHTLISSGRNGKIIIWDLQTGKTRHLSHYPNWQPIGAIHSTAIDPKGTVMASSDSGGSISLYNLKTARVVRIPSSSIAPEQAIVLSPDAKTLISSSSDSHMKFWNVETGELRRSFPAFQGGSALALTSTLALSSDSTILASGSWGGGMGLWDFQTGKLIQALSGHDQPVSALAISPNNTRLISGGEDHLIRLWDLTTGSRLQTLEGHQGTISTLAVSPDNQFLVSGSTDQTIRIWRLQDGKLLHTLSSSN